MAHVKYFRKAVLYYLNSKEVYPPTFHTAKPQVNTSQLTCHDLISLTSLVPDTPVIHKNFLLSLDLQLLLSINQNL